MAKFRPNKAAIRSAVSKAMRETAFVMGNEFTAVISTPGLFAGFPGDIVDTGALRASQTLTFPDPFTARFTWGVDYAIYVHEGYQKRNGEFQPGRPWTTLALERRNFKNVFQELLIFNL